MSDGDPQKPRRRWSFRRVIRIVRRLAVQAGGFAASTLILSVLALLMIPAMIAAGGSEVWSYVALGQGVGAIIMVFVGWGWWIGGPARVARANAVDRAAEYRASAVARSVLFLVSVPPTFGLSYLIAPHAVVEVFLGAVFSASAGLTAAWYFAGVQRPYVLLVTETLPRALGTGAAILYLVLGGNIYLGVGLQTMGVIAGFVATTAWVLVSPPPEVRADAAAARIPVLRVLWQRRLGLTASFLSATYRAMPIVLVSWFAPLALAPFALMDKIGLQINTGIQPLISASQGWIPHLSSDRGRLRSALAAFAMLAAVGGMGLYFVFPVLTLILGAGEIRPDSSLIAVFCVFIALAFFDTSLFKAFLPAIDRIGVASIASTASLVVGIPAILLGVAYWGAAGAMAGVVVGLLLKIVIELVAILRA